MLRFISKWCLFSYRYCMGLTNSREMEDVDIVEDGNADTDADTELDSILDILISSGQMRLINGDRCLQISANQSWSNGESNMEHFQNNAIAQETKRSSGDNTCSKHMKSLTDMIMYREIGMGKGLSFSRSQKCRINNCKIPSRMRMVDCYDHKAFCGIYSPDGTKLLTACQDRLLRVYDISNRHTFKVAHVIPGRDVGWSILDVAFAPDGQNIAYTSWSSNIHMFNISEDTSDHQALALCPEERRFCVFCLQFSSDGREILCGANDGHMYICNREIKSNSTSRVEAHGDDVNAVSFADETSQIIYSGGDDGFCKVWDRRTLSEKMPKPVGVLAGHMKGITYIDSRGDARYFISNSKDQSIKLWDIRMFSANDAQESTKKIVMNSKWDYRWQDAPRNYAQNKKIKGDTSVATYKGHSVLQTLIRCHFSPAFSTGQRYIYTGDSYGKLLVFDVLTGRIVKKLAGHTSCIRDVSWHPFKPEIVTSSWDYTVACWSHTGADLSETQPASKNHIFSEMCPRRSRRLAM